MNARRIACVAMASCLVLLPAVISGQTQLSGSIAGVVRDTSGAVMPGVTVEATSPVALQGARS